LAQPGGTLQSGFFSATNGSLAGQGSAFYIGNETTGASGFRYVNSGRQSNGQIDEFAIWNRVVTTNEVLAQFNALTLAPRLALAVSGANAVLSWSSSADPRFVLESTVSLAAPSWSSAGAPSVADGQYRVTNSLGSEPQFYRLRKPSL
jgi:hypothetical protein